MTSAPSFVTQVSQQQSGTLLTPELEGAVRQRRASVSAGRARKASLSADHPPEVPDPAETETRTKIVERRPRGSSMSLHEKKPTAPFRDDHLLPPLPENGRYAHPKFGKKCLVLDLDETLVHSSFKPVEKYDFVIPVEIEGSVYQVYVAKRPGVDEFMKKVGELFEVVVFTASLSVYANPLLDKLDIHKGTYVKDMCRMGRDMKRILIIDNSPHAFAFNPENAIPCESWFDDYEDVELYDLIPILAGLAEESVQDIPAELELLQINGVAAVEQGYGDSDSESGDSGDEV